MAFTQEAVLIKRATNLAVIVAGILILAKFYAWYVSGSISVQASLLDSILDIFASFVNFFAVRKAMKPADYYHRFGYGKVEALAGVGQTLFIMGSGVWLLFEIYERFESPKQINDINIVTIVMLGSALLTGLLVLYQRHVISKTNSVAIEADSLHYKTDMYTNLGIVVGVFASVYFSVVWLDALIGVVIVGYLIHSSIQIVRSSFNILIDRELPEADRTRVMDIVRAHPKVYGVHDLKTRSAGLYEFFQMHLDLDESINLREAHDIAEEVEIKILESYPKSEVIIHQDPVKVTNEGFKRDASRVKSWIKHKTEWCGDYEHTDFDTEDKDKS